MFVPSTLPQVELTDLFTGIVAAQRADIFIGAHGGSWLEAGWSAVVLRLPMDVLIRCAGS